jgi:hypothetical protein
MMHSPLLKSIKTLAGLAHNGALLEANLHLDKRMGKYALLR